ncbi:MAG: hypothetical protein ACOYM2_16575 [Rectinemataceae bacterium]
MSETPFLKVPLPTLASQIPPVQKVLVLGLMSYEWAGYSPSHEDLAERCGLNLRSVERALTAMAVVGIITTTPRYRKGKRRISNLYTINTDKLTALTVDQYPQNDGTQSPQIDGIQYRQNGESIPTNSVLNTVKVAGILIDIDRIDEDRESALSGDLPGEKREPRGSSRQPSSSEKKEARPPRPAEKGLGINENVHLTEGQQEAIRGLYGPEAQAEYIERLSLWMPNAEKKPKDHYSKIITFMREDHVPEVQLPPPTCPECGKNLSDRICINPDCPQYADAKGFSFAAFHHEEDSETSPIPAETSPIPAAVQPQDVAAATDQAGDLCKVAEVAALPQSAVAEIAPDATWKPSKPAPMPRVRRDGTDSHGSRIVQGEISHADWPAQISASAEPVGELEIW